MSGDSPKLSGCCLTRAGEGYDIDRIAEYSYKHLAVTFKDKLAEPFMVTVHPNDKEVKLHSHDDQEFNFVVSGQANFFIGDAVHVLKQGDTVYFDASIPHAMKAIGSEPAKFIAIVMKGDSN
jgi:quercetin dioxygenase-like cupin family protein